MNTTTHNTLSSQIIGNDYFSAYRSRMEVNNRYFLDVARELTEAGCKVYVAKDGLIGWIRVENEDRHINFGFTEVPYRWYLSYDLDPSKGQGSGRTLKTEYEYNSPFTAKDIIQNMQPNPKKQFKTASYMKLFEIAN